MPRILPRLLKALQEPKAHTPLQLRPIPPANLKRRNRTKSLWHPLPTVSYSARGRTQSILLDELNPVVHHDKFERHKLLPPKVYLTNGTRRTRRHASEGEADRPRSMTQEEREWWASPYLRMLSSPLRSCIATSENFPMDFLVRVAPMRLPVPRGARIATTLLPDGIEHPRFRHLKSGTGIYILCRKEAIGYLSVKERYKAFAPNLSVHSRLAEQISHLLRVRVLQELELLADRLQCRPSNSQDHPVLRRLTRAEWRNVRNTGVIPYNGAVALLVVPPLNRDPKTRRRPEPSSSSQPIEDAGKIPDKALPPLSVLHSTAAEGLVDEDADSPSLIPNARVPLYNGLSLFPLRPQRAALYAALNKLLFVERRARWREHGRPEPLSKSEAPGDSVTTEKVDKWARGDRKASHAYLLCSDSETLLRADAAPLAIALWRIRMWEGAGYHIPPDKRWKLKSIPLPS